MVTDMRDFLAAKGLMLPYKFMVGSMKKMWEYFVPQILLNIKERNIFIEVGIFLLTGEVLQHRGVWKPKYLGLKNSL